MRGSQATTLGVPLLQEIMPSLWAAICRVQAKRCEARLSAESTMSPSYVIWHEKLRVSYMAFAELPVRSSPTFFAQYRLRMILCDKRLNRPETIEQLADVHAELFVQFGRLTGNGLQLRE